MGKVAAEKNRSQNAVSALQVYPDGLFGDASEFGVMND
tara:strand:- start:80 stop:193 length:114 start_codon:yes stop_codon:yes gene_type:complete